VGGFSEKRRICWVNWKEVCLPKKNRGLGVRNLEFVNISLLGKWRWGLLLESKQLWKKVMLARYGGML